MAPRAWMTSIGDCWSSPAQPPLPASPPKAVLNNEPTPAPGFLTRVGTTPMTFTSSRIRRLRSLGMARSRLVVPTSNWPVRVFCKLAPLVPVPLTWARAVRVPLTSPRFSGANVFTSGAMGT